MSQNQNDITHIYQSSSDFMRALEAHPDRHAMKECRLFEEEIFWRDHYLWLKEQGYLLRPRYHPDWVASWKDSEKQWGDVEDGLLSKFTMLMDATRVEDGQQVILKQLYTPDSPGEVDLGRLFSKEPHANHAHNHCVRIYDVLDVPDEEGLVLLVMPFLSDWRTPEFDTVGEFVGFVQQIFEGLKYMHSLHVAHNDVKWNNIMMDFEALYDEPVHPVRRNMKHDFSDKAKRPRSRTDRPVKYYYIDFGLSKQYDPEQGPVLVGGIGYGGDRTVPEFETQRDCDPFPVDVYRAGNLVRAFKKGHRYHAEKDHREFEDLEFMEPLLKDMCQDDPKKRPTMDEVVARFANITKSVSGWKLRSRMRQLGDPDSLVLFSKHWTKQVVRIVRHVPSIPRPPPRGN